jgi:hypothetical protein
MPDGIVVTSTAGDLKIEHRWCGPESRAGIAVLGLVGVGLAAAPLFAGVTLLAFAVGASIGLPVLYVAGALALNRTWIDASDAALRVRHGPLPWFGARAIDAAAIASIETEIVRVRGKTVSALHRVHAVLRGSEAPVPILTLETSEQAATVKRHLAEHLGLAGDRGYR